VGVEALLRRRRPWLAVAVLVGGQTALLGLPEAMAEATAGAGGRGGEGDAFAALGFAVGLQVVIAAAAVGVAVVIDTVLLSLPRPLLLPNLPAVALVAPAAPIVPAGRIAGGVRGRGPPVTVFH
jgi:hypothetical protein